MRCNFTRFSLLLTLAFIAWVTPYSRADLEVGVSFSITSESDFYEPLAPQGGWVEVDNFGRCWRPSRVAVGWEPYCEGRWVWTDCGWYWESDEPWAWACYHYGRWYRHPVHHWVWIPGREWAPAWVSWRSGGGYIGWAPLAPVRAGVVIAPAPFVFIQTARFHQPIRRSTVIVNNTTVINKTTIINNNVRTETRNIAGVGQRRVNVNDGPGVEVVQKATRRTFKPTPVQEVTRKTISAAPAEFVRKQTERTSNRREGREPNENRNNVQPPSGPGAPATVKPNLPRPESRPEAPKPEPARPEPARPVAPERTGPTPRRVAPPEANPAQPAQPAQPVRPAPPAVERSKQPPQQPERNVNPTPRRSQDYRQPRGRDWDTGRGRSDSRGKGGPHP